MYMICSLFAYLISYTCNHAQATSLSSGRELLHGCTQGILLRGGNFGLARTAQFHPNCGIRVMKQLGDDSQIGSSHRTQVTERLALYALDVDFRCRSRGKKSRLHSCLSSVTRVRASPRRGLSFYYFSICSFSIVCLLFLSFQSSDSLRDVEGGCVALHSTFNFRGSPMCKGNIQLGKVHASLNKPETR